MIQPSLTGLVHALFATQHCVLGLEFLHFQGEAAPGSLAVLRF
jgi:hypothetical protein